MRKLSLLFPALLAASLGLADDHPLPIIDMHLHAFPIASDEVGPTACVPPTQMPSWDQRRPYPVQLWAHMAPLNCAGGLASAAPDGEELMRAST